MEISPETAAALRDVAYFRLFVMLSILGGMLLMVLASVFVVLGWRKSALVCFALYGVSALKMEIGYSNIFGLVILTVSVAGLLWLLVSSPKPATPPAA